MKIPSLILKQLYNFNSLENTDGGVQFVVKNRLSDATLTAIKAVTIGDTQVPLADITLVMEDGSKRAAAAVSADNPVEFSLRTSVTMVCAIPALAEGKYTMTIVVDTTPFGELPLEVEDGLSTKDANRVVIPRDKNDDYSEAAIKTRQAFVKEYTGADLTHTSQYSFDPHILAGNCEHFTGVAQIPLGIAGPLHVNGEHAQGDFLIPLATS